MWQGIAHAQWSTRARTATLPMSRFMRPGLHAIWLPFLLLLALATALGIGLWLSALNALYRDVGYVTPFLVQFWMLASPAAYASSLVPEKWRWLYGLNPIAGVIEGFRWVLTGNGQAPGQLMLASAAAAVVLLVGGLMFFQRMEGTGDSGGSGVKDTQGII
jgi:lipopolysaccharide transport system permease protein